MGCYRLRRRNGAGLTRFSGIPTTLFSSKGRGSRLFQNMWIHATGPLRGPCQPLRQSQYLVVKRRLFACGVPPMGQKGLTRDGKTVRSRQIGRIGVVTGRSMPFEAVWGPRIEWRVMGVVAGAAWQWASTVKGDIKQRVVWAGMWCWGLRAHVVCNKND